jgi:hypothetical protein
MQCQSRREYQQDPFEFAALLRPPGETARRMRNNVAIARDILDGQAALWNQIDRMSVSNLQSEGIFDYRHQNC